MPAGRAYRVRGRVQGVGFRWWVQREATRLRVSGSVANEPDGSVLVIAWGDDAALARLEALLGKGPVPARVDAVERLAEPEPPAPEEFSIAR